MPLNPDLGGQSYETFKEEFSDRIIEMLRALLPEHDKREHPRTLRL